METYASPGKRPHSNVLDATPAAKRKAPADANKRAVRYKIYERKGDVHIRFWIDANDIEFRRHLNTDVTRLTPSAFQQFDLSDVFSDKAERDSQLEEYDKLRVQLRDVSDAQLRAKVNALISEHASKREEELGKEVARSPFSVEQEWMARLSITKGDLILDCAERKMPKSAAVMATPTSSLSYSVSVRGSCRHITENAYVMALETVMRTFVANDRIKRVTRPLLERFIPRAILDEKWQNSNLTIGELIHCERTCGMYGDCVVHSVHFDAKSQSYWVVLVECDDQAIDDEDLHHESDDDEKNVNAADIDYACPSDQDSADESSDTSDMDEDDAVYRGEEESRLRHMLQFVSQCRKSARESPTKKV